MNKLLSFTVTNSRSFHDAQTVSLERKHLGPRRSSTIPVLGFFGANGSGKTNFAHALDDFRHMVLDSSTAQWRLPYVPFMFLDTAQNEPTRYVIRFCDDEAIYEYLVSFNARAILEEVLTTRPSAKPTAKATTIFCRSAQEFTRTPLAGSGFTKALLGRTRPDTLLITKAYEDNNAYSQAMFDFVRSLAVAHLDGRGSFHFDPFALEQNQAFYDELRHLIQVCDFDIRGFRRDETVVPNSALNAFFLANQLKPSESDGRAFQIKTIHTVRDKDRKIVGEYALDYDTQESQGTRAFILMACQMLLAVKNGFTLYIDEFGNDLSPELSLYLIKWFKKRAGEHGATLLFTTQNTAILSALTRDEILIVEKDFAECSTITPLAKKHVRENEPFEKRFRSGLYGGVPYISDDEDGDDWSISNDMNSTVGAQV